MDTVGSPSYLQVMPQRARVLFDESHSQAWTIRPEIARAIQPSHPEDSSYARAADVLRARDFAVAAHTDGPLDREALAGADVLVIAHPSDPKWERTVPSGSPRLSGAELDAVEAFVRDGGGLILLAEEEQDKYGNNLAELGARFGVRLNSDLVSDYERHDPGAPHWVLIDEAHHLFPRGGSVAESMFDFDVSVTGGLLKNSFGSEAYIRLAAERWSTFNGSFTQDFSAGKIASNIRGYFPMSAQAQVHRVVTRYVGYAQQFLAEHPHEGYTAVNGAPPQCRATTRKGAACQRMPLAHNGYCPSHQHLADTEDRELAAA